MADLADGPLVRINDIEISGDAIVSESLNLKNGKNINGLIAARDDHETRITTLEGGTPSDLKLHNFLFDSSVNSPGQVLNTVYTTPNGKQIFEFKFNYLSSRAQEVFQIPTATTGFGGGNLIWPTFEQTGGGGQKIHPMAYTLYPGITGEIKYKKDGTLITKAMLWQIVGGSSESIAVAWLAALNPESFALKFRISVLYEA